jgi:hypothetical protein
MKRRRAGRVRSPVAEDAVPLASRERIGRTVP